MSGLFGSVLIKDEASYAAAGTPTFTRALEFTSESIKGVYERIESESIRSGNRVLRSDRWAANPKGAAGDLEFEVMSRGFGGLFKYMLGSVTLDSTVTDSAYDHTAKVGALTGSSFAVQVQRPLVGGDPTVAGGYASYLYKGGKVLNWELSNDVDGILQCSLGCDFASETVNATYVAPTFPAGATEVFTFVGGTATFNGSTVSLKNVSVKGDNALNSDRYFVGNAGVKKEPLEAGMREYSLDFTMDFDSTNRAYYDTNVTAGTALTNVVLKWQAPTLIGATAKPEFTVTLPYVRLDGDTPTISGMELLEVPLSGKVLDSSDANGPVQFTLRTAETNLTVVY